MHDFIPPFVLIAIIAASWSLWEAMTRCFHSKVSQALWNFPLENQAKFEGQGLIVNIGYALFPSRTYQAEAWIGEEGLGLKRLVPIKASTLGSKRIEGCLIPWTAGIWNCKKARTRMFQSSVLFKFSCFPLQMHFFNYPALESSFIDQLICALDSSRSAAEQRLPSQSRPVE